jgi:hypothetical protein
MAPWSFDDQEIGVAISAAPSLADFADFTMLRDVRRFRHIPTIGGYGNFGYHEAYKDSCTQMDVSTTMTVCIVENTTNTPIAVSRWL